MPIDSNHGIYREHCPTRTEWHDGAAQSFGFIVSAMRREVAYPDAE
jgi:hypothetical protein